VPRRLINTAGLALAAVLSAGCASSTSSTSSTAGAPAAGFFRPSPASAEPAVSSAITVFAAASLTTAFTELGKQFETTHPGTAVTFSFGASSTLAQQIIAAAPADVFAAASPSTMKQVTDAGDATDAMTFATNVAEIAVAPRSAGKVTGLADLAKPGVKVALCQPQVPCGALAQTVLAKAKVLITPVTQGLDVKSTLAYVTSGEADAAIVYVTDVQAAGAAVTGIPIPAESNASTAYPIATVKGSKNPVLAAAFTDFVLSAAGRGVLRGAGFSTP